MAELTPEEKQRIYEEEKTRLEAQVQIKKKLERKKTKPATWGCLILIIFGIIMLANLFSPSKKQVTSTKSVTPTKKSIPKVTQKDENTLKLMIESGLVEKITPKFNEVFVNPLVWARLKYQEKKNLTRFLAEYCGKKKGTGISWVDIKDSYSGKKLAKYSTLGFKVY